MKVFYIILIVAGISIDVISFIRQLVAVLRSTKLSPTIGPGFILMAIGVHNLIILAEPRVGIFELERWKWFLIFLGFALFLHISFQILLPLLVTMICNKYYGRKLLDTISLSTLRKKTSDPDKNDSIKNRD